MKKFLLLFFLSFFLFIPTTFVFAQTGKCGGVSSCVYQILGVEVKTYCSVQCGPIQAAAAECTGCPGSVCNCKCVEDPKCKITPTSGPVPTPPTTVVRPLEVVYPEIEGFKPETAQTDIAEYVRYIYYFFVVIAGFFAMGALFYGGFRYMTSVGNPEALKDAKDQIFAALLGLLILLSSWLILYNINPQLIVLHVPILKPPLSTLSPGVWLCKEPKSNEFALAWQYIEDFKIKEKELETAIKERQEEIIRSLQELSKKTDDSLKAINEKCYLNDGSGNIKRDYDNKVTDVYLVPQKEGDDFKNYAAILFEEQSYKGKNELVYMQNIYEKPIEGTLSSNPNPIKEPSSIIPFVINPNPSPNWKITTYEEVDYNKGFEEGAKKKQVFPDECSNKDSYWCAGQLNPSPQSIEYNHAGGYITILTKDDNYTSTEVFFTSDSNLLDNELITNQDCTLWFFRCETIPAAKTIFLISGYIY